MFRQFLLLVSVVVVSAWKSEVLDRHNEFRSKVATGQQPNLPAAKYMARMVWDDALAAEAQAFADSCPDDHAQGDFGENMAWDSRPNSYNAMVSDWYNEVKLAPKVEPGNNLLISDPIGHFTQLIWAESKSLGCGYNENCGGMATLICRYMPGQSGGQIPQSMKQAQLVKNVTEPVLMVCVMVV